MDNGDERDRLDLGDGPTMWLVDHQLVFVCLFAVLAGTLGYFGQLGRMGPQPVSPGIPGLMYGAGSVFVVYAVVLAWTKLRGRRR